MTTLEAVAEIKRLMVAERKTLMAERSAISKKIAEGADFFTSSKQYTRSEMGKAAEVMKRASVQLAAVDKKIFDLDVIIGTKLESLFADFEVRVTTAKKMNDMSEGVMSSESIFSLYEDSEKTTITPEDLWAIKILKPALKYCNIEIVKSTSDT
jgi:hypothetical protein